MKVAYLGIPGSYSYIAAQKYFGSSVSMVGLNNFKQIFDSVSSDKVNVGLVPVENSLTGSIYQTYDLLLERKLKIVGETILKIKHCLLINQIKINNKTQMLKKIRVCFSHPEAIKQCQSFFEKHKNIKPVFVSDTASAAKQLKIKKSEKACVISNAETAKLYGLSILRDDVQDNPNNYTRFVVVSRDSEQNGNKVSLIFSVVHKPGSLVKILEPYADLGLNLTKIESRPVAGKPWEYIFIVDFELNDSSDLHKVLGQMKNHANFIKVLGRFEKGKIYES